MCFAKVFLSICLSTPFEDLQFGPPNRVRQKVQQGRSNVQYAFQVAQSISYPDMGFLFLDAWNWIPGVRISGSVMVWNQQFCGCALWKIHFYVGDISQAYPRWIAVCIRIRMLHLSCLFMYRSIQWCFAKALSGHLLFASLSFCASVYVTKSDFVPGHSNQRINTSMHHAACMLFHLALPTKKNSGKTPPKVYKNTNKVGPLPVVSRVISPLIGVITPVNHLFSAIYRDYNSI